MDLWGLSQESDNRNKKNIPTFNELEIQYDQKRDEFLKLCDISDLFSDFTSTIKAGSNVINDAFNYLNNEDYGESEQNENCVELQNFENVKNELGFITAKAIQKYGETQSKVGIIAVKAGLCIKKIEVQSDMQSIETKMKKYYPDEYNDKMNPYYRFSGGGASASW